MKRKYLTLGTIAFVGILFVGIIVWQFGIWKSIDSISGCKNMFENEITEITMRKTIDALECVSFEDEELIAKWEAYLKNLNVKLGWPFLAKEDHDTGGTPMVTIKTDTDTYHLYFETVNGKEKIQIGRMYYDMDSSEKELFEEIYEDAVETYGTIPLY